MTSAATAALSRAAGLDLAAYRRDHVDERVRRAFAREGVADVAGLVVRIERDTDARARFRRSVAVSVSGLFRDPQQFDLLEQRLLPPLIEDGRRVTVWSAGCADGSELYSVGLLFERLDVLDRAVLLGSDLLEENLAAARRGRYGDVAISPALRARVRWELRDLVREGPPAGAWRLVLCRNVAIYLSAEAKRALHEALVGALARGGILLLGRSERILHPRELGLEPAGAHAYRRVR